MIPIILIVVGIIVMLRKTVSLSQTSELRRPKTYIFGGIIIATAIIDAIIVHQGQRGDVYTVQQLIYDIIPLLIPLIAIPFLKQQKLNTSSEPTKKGVSKTTTIIGWIIILGFVGILIYALLGNS